MKTSESITALATALATAQGQLGAAKKDTDNMFFKSKYADLSSVVDAIKACFPANGLSYVQTVVTADHGVGVETMLLHSSGEWICGDPFFIPVNKADAQGFGSALTYARRYSLSAIAGVKADDDDGNAAAAAKPILPAAIPANTEGHDLFAALPTDAQTLVLDDVKEMSALVAEGNLAGALEILTDRYPSQEDQLILASQMPSGPRNKIKAYRRTLGVEGKSPALASQP